MTLNEYSCRLCLKTDEKYELIDDFTKDILNVLSLRLILDDRKKPLMCTTCSEKIKLALEFKSICLATDDTIFPYIDCEELQLNLRDIYMKESGSKQSINLSVDQKVCSLCMQLVGHTFIDIREEEVKTIHKFVPEMNINVVRDPVICKRCFESLNAHNSFLGHCLEVEEKIGYMEMEVKDNECDEISVTSRGIDKKFEEKQQGSNLREKIHSGTQNVEETSIIRARTEFDTLEREEAPSELEIRPLMDNDQSRTQIHDVPKQKDALEVQSHTLKGKKPPEVQVYSCQVCSFQTKYNNTFRKHQFAHTCPDVQLLKCKKCSYKTMYKAQLTVHKRTHKKHSNTQIYKCEKCKYQTTVGKLLRKHNLMHEEYEGTQMYACDKCKYQTKIWDYFRRHQLKHEDTPHYKCDKCEYQSNVKRYFNRHQFLHGEGTNTQVYVCGKCEYQSNNTNYFRWHQSKHEENKGARTYKCDICEYQSCIRKDLRVHKMTHEEYSGTQNYKCGKCKYQSNIRKNFYRHQLWHGEGKNIKIFKCEECDYQSTVKIYFCQHQSRHKKYKGTHIYKCDECKYQSKIRKNFHKHKLTHERRKNSGTGEYGSTIGTHSDQ
ncbi:zinc finger protein 99-like [Anoplophora glabripennis]|uniref:zinc finger protein 99-like n=1 Tax=Anoplophora glabripennis TaxID=217634 RepID=UPI0008735FF6|nr:zinc finger protein 99-like [Anoplophora glabripennis]